VSRTPISVRIAGSGAWAAEQRFILATLPNSYRLVKNDAEVLAIGEDVEEPLAVLEKINPRGIFLASPGALSSSQLAALIARNSRAVVVGSRTVAALSPQAMELLAVEDEPLVVDAAAQIGPEITARTALYELLDLLNAVGAKITALEPQIASDRHWIFRAVDAGSWKGVRLSIRRGVHTSFAIATMSRTLRRSIRIVTRPHAAPADVRLFTSDGLIQASPSYEGGLRRSWQLLHDALHGVQMRGSRAPALLQLVDRAMPPGAVPENAAAR
jgi:hypothetical protein